MKKRLKELLLLTLILFISVAIAQQSIESKFGKEVYLVANDSSILNAQLIIKKD
jgi:hypothetical protein